MNHVFHTAAVEQNVQVPAQAIHQTNGDFNRSSVISHVQHNAATGAYNEETARNTYFKDPLYQYAFYLWMLGAIVSLVTHFIGYARFLTRVKRTNVAATDQDTQMLTALLNGRKRVRLVRNRFVKTPMLIGVLRPCIILPDYHFNEKQLKNILLHEIVHLRRSDLAIKWFTMIVTSIHWFNPLMYFIRKEIHFACELACDEAVIKNLNADEKQAYGDTLISIAEKNSKIAGALQVTMYEEKKNLKERLVAIMHFNKKPKFVVFFSSVLVLAILVSAAALGASAGKITDKDQPIQTVFYQLTVPEDWTTEQLPGYSLSFEKDGTIIGGLDPIAYYAGQRILPFRPNHTEVIESRQLEGYFTEVILEKSQHTPPAASGDSTTKETIHIYFMMNDKKMMYDLYFNTADIDEQTALSIAKSFKLTSDSHESLAGFIVLEGNTVWIDEVEVITREDEKRIAELDLKNEDMPNGYYIHNLNAETKFFELTDRTEYTFTDFNLLFVEDADGDRRYTTTKKAQFIEHLNTSLSNVPFTGKIPYPVFIEVQDGKVISITEELLFTQ